jgi:hypothetical protein
MLPMHPIEHLRYVARATGADPAVVAHEAAAALADMARLEPAGLVPACRRLIERHLVAGPIWWLSARILGAEDPVQAARGAMAELAGDETDRHLAAVLPDGATVMVVGWPDISGAALRRRGDAEVLVVDSGGEGAPLVRRLDSAGNEATLVPDSGIGPAAAVSDLVLIEALAAGPPGVMAAPGSLAAAAVAAHSLIPVWAVAGVGRVLPLRLWEAIATRLDQSGHEPWDRPAELVGADLISRLIGPDGEVDTDGGLAAATCPAAPELFRAAG